MQDDKRDREITKEAIGDPAFYNDKLAEDYHTGKEISEKGKGGKNGYRSPNKK